MDAVKVSKAWLDQSKNDWEVVQSLFEKKHYAYALFFCHLALEKLVKAVIVQRTGGHALYSHDLLLLAQKAELNPNTTQRRQLAEINSFSIRARYDDIKRAFYRKAKKGYTEKYIAITSDLVKWLNKEFQKK